MNEEELELLVKIAAREQRYAMVERRLMFAAGHDVSGMIQNTPCPDAQTVIDKWRKELARKQPTAS